MSASTMRRTARNAWITVAALAIGGCAAPTVKQSATADPPRLADPCDGKQAEVPPGTEISAEAFRCRFPLGPETDAILADYAVVQDAVMQASAHGAEMFVTMLSANGGVHGGRDVFYAGGNPRIKEMRDNYTAVQVGSRSCWQSKGEAMVCKAVNPLHLGLFDVPKDHVARIWSRDFRCVDPDEACRFIKVELGSRESDTNAMDGYTADPEIVGHEYEVAFRVADHLPMYVRQIDHYHVAVTAIAFYAYRFGGDVEPVELPRDGETLDEAPPRGGD